MAYAALASLLQITHQMLNPDPYSIPCDTKQIESLNQSVVSLLTFLENCSSQTILKSLDLESRIREVAYKVEDILETHVANHFLHQDHDNFNLNMMCNALKEAMNEIASIEKDLKEKNIIQDGDGFAGSSRPAWRGKNVLTVGINDELMIKIMDQLVGHRSGLEVIPIVGMGGIGKTTLARTLFNNQLIIEKFDIRAWVTISQEYRLQDVVNGLVDEIDLCLNTKNESAPCKERVKARSREHIHKSLFGRRYFIILDDVWSTKAWEDVKMLFPDNDMGSRIMLTTRHVEVASFVNPYHHELNLLDENMSWDLLSQALFGQEHCPSKLVSIGQEVAKRCRGLPLAIVVIAGLLSKKMTRGYWEYVADNVSSILAINDEQYCLQILSLSYNYLPQNLKACFLYMGVFPEDYEISISKLVKLWVAEGFLKPVKSKSLEEIAEESLRDLIDRNLVLVLQEGSNKKPKTCNIHDLLREICIREAKKENFLYILIRYVHFDPDEANKQRRLSVHPSVIEDVDTSSDDDSDDDSSSGDDNTRNGVEVLFNVMKSMPLTRSFLSPAEFPSKESKFNFVSKLLRVMDFEKDSSRFPKEILQLVNIRYLGLDHLRGLPSSVGKLWNLQTLIASDLAGKDLPQEIWDMTQLRHFKIRNCYLVDKNSGKKCSRVLKNLQTLSGVMNFKCNKKVLARIPNLRRLKITYDENPKRSDWSRYRLCNLYLLSELNSLSCFFDGVVPNETFMESLALPSSLRKLTLRGCRIPWEHMTVIGALPNLEVLKLQNEAFQGNVWETNEDEFVQLKFLLLENPVDLVEWRVESTHFPLLQHLILRECNMEEIPSDIGEISTLETIELFDCCPDTEISVKDLQEECGDNFKVIVHPRKNPRHEISSSSGGSSSYSDSCSSSGSSSSSDGSQSSG